MNRRATKPDQNAQSEDWVLGPSVSLPALLDKGPVPDATFRQFVYDISVVGEHLGAARQYLAERLGVTPPQYNILMVIARSGGDGIRVSDVAERLNVTGAFVTNEVKKLVKAQFIVKKSNPDDGRGVLLSLSVSGMERIKSIEPDLLMVNDRLFGTLTREDFLHLARTVGSLVDVFGQTVAVLKALSATAGNEEKRAPVARKKASKTQGG
ncbi:MarR family winged helix-turn-helix transcriptional regulator [Massilia putida]|uniref:MarR family winged helix-turn-helix transcriptional regulator n=1 Tax=Massilia putida TaxID=1141883 RepID=UPI000952A88C|nr:MarR family transcriptional regulator [Massilia putida]